MEAKVPEAIADSASASVSGGTAAFQLDFRGQREFLAGTLLAKDASPRFKCKDAIPDSKTRAHEKDLVHVTLAPFGFWLIWLIFGSFVGPPKASIMPSYESPSLRYPCVPFDPPGNPSRALLPP